MATVGANESQLSATSGSGSEANSSKHHGQLSPIFLYTTICMAIGLVGNSLVIYVYGYRWKLKHVTTVFITFLATLDLSTCAFCLPAEMTVLYLIISFDYPIVCKTKTFLNYTLNAATTLTLLAIALERWLKISRPHALYFDHRKATMTCLGTLVVAACVTWPALILYGTLSLPIKDDPNSWGKTCLIADEYFMTVWPLVFYSVFTSVFVSVVIAITVLYAKLALEMVRLKRIQMSRIGSATTSKVTASHDELSKGSKVASKATLASTGASKVTVESKDDNCCVELIARCLVGKSDTTTYNPSKTTTVLFSVTFICFISYFPFFVIVLLRSLRGPMFFMGLTDIDIIAINLFIRFTYISNVANPFIYGAMNKQFRGELLRLIGFKGDLGSIT